MLNLIEPIEELAEKQRKLKAAFEQEFNGLETARQVLLKMNEACLVCGGKGKVLRKRACAEDDRPDPDDPSDWYKCTHCNGSGREPKIEVRGGKGNEVKKIIDEDPFNLKGGGASFDGFDFR